MGEIALMESINSALHGSEFITTIVKNITMLGEWGSVWLLLGFVMLFSKKTRVPGLVMLGSLALGFFLNDFIIKKIFMRPRPFQQSAEILAWLETTGYKLPTGFSFPSGHTLCSFACAGVCLSMFGKRGLPALSVAILIGLSRIYMCVHFTTDVLTGAVIGLLISRVVMWYYNTFWPKISRWLYKQKFNLKAKKQ